MRNRLIGYARGRRRLGGVDDQLASLRAERCNIVFSDADIGSSYPKFEELLDSLEAGDTVIVTNLDRIAGSLFELLSNLKRINGKGGRLRSLAEPWVDSATSTGALTLTVLELLADLDRNFKRIAAATGRHESKSKGTHLGRASKLTARQLQEAKARREAGESPAAIATSYGVSRSTIVRLTHGK